MGIGWNWQSIVAAALLGMALVYLIRMGVRTWRRGNTHDCPDCDVPGQVMKNRKVKKS